MATLGEYLGALVAEVTSARLQGDLESVRIAELYAAHPLLRHMPVPRFRLPAVTLDIPIAVDGFDPPRVSRAEVVAQVGDGVDGAVTAELTARDVQLSAAARKRLRAVTDKIVAGLAVTEVPSDGQVAEAAKAVLEAMRELADGAGAASDRDEAFVRALTAELVKLRPAPPRVRVLTTSADLKNIAAPQTLTRISLRLSEEGMEWTETGPADAPSRRLIPE